MDCVILTKGPDFGTFYLLLKKCLRSADADTTHDTPIHTLAVARPSTPHFLGDTFFISVMPFQYSTILQ